MRRSEERPDPWSFAMRPLYATLFGTVAVAICGFLVYGYFGSRPHDLFVPVDARSGEAATLGIYVINNGYGKFDPETGVFIHCSVFNTNAPHGLVIAAWDDGRVAWTTGARPEDGELAWGRTDAKLVAAAREQLVKAMDEPAWPSEPPYVYSDGPRSVLFVRDGERYQTIWCQSWQVEPKVEDETRLRPFREKWFACRGIAMTVIPTIDAAQGADWIGFQRDDK